MVGIMALLPFLVEICKYHAGCFGERLKDTFDLQLAAVSLTLARASAIHRDP